MYGEALRTKKLLEKERKKVRKLLDKLPAEKFRCYAANKNSNVYNWYIVRRVDGKNEKIYISKKNRKLAEQLAQRAYLQALLNDLDNELEAVNRYLRKHRQIGKSNQYANRNDGYKALVKPLFELQDKELVEWASNYKKLDYKLENLIFKGLDGEKYRSKSESILATRLYERGIPFRYEGAIELSNGRIVYPDFIIKNPYTGEIFIWEHLGMMDKEEYYESNMRKVLQYNQSGFMLNRNLILTIEDNDAHLDIEEIDRLIDTVILGLKTK